MQDLRQVFNGKKVFLTGHTGFKGAWMLQLLHHLGAIVKGYSLAPEQDQDLYNQINGEALCYASVIDDIRNAQVLQGEIIRFEPDFVFHFAAQALVRKSYEIPVDTFSTNVMGTVHILEAMRHLETPCTGIIITTDKVYENNEKGLPFLEQDKLGGYDPYSASKAASEIAISSYINSFFNPADYTVHQKSIVSMRAGNVIGGGDYSTDRIIPDIVRAIQQDVPVQLRNPQSVRPWQHVIEPLYAYLQMAAHLQEHPTQYATAYNIGPEAADVLDVKTVTEQFIQAFGRGQYETPAQNGTAVHEAKLLLLDNTRIKEDIGFRPKLNAQQAIEWTAEWYADKERTAAEKCCAQLEAYMAL